MDKVKLHKHLINGVPIDSTNQQVEPQIYKKKKITSKQKYIIPRQGSYNLLARDENRYIIKKIFLNNNRKLTINSYPS